MEEAHSSPGATISAHEIGTKRYMLVYGIATFCAPICWFICYANYDSICQNIPEGACVDYSPPVPWFITATFDYVWFLSLPLAPVFLPNNSLLNPEALLKAYDPELAFVETTDNVDNKL